MLVVENEKVVSITYELKAIGSDEIVEKIDHERPLVFLVGSGFLLPEFENNLKGLAYGDSFDFILKSEDAYGDFDEKAIVSLPRELLIGEGKYAETEINTGMVIPMQTKDGERVTGTILEIDLEKIKLDFNHPMSGKDLNFKGKVVDIRDATQEEKEHKHIHQASGCENCNQDQDSCGSGCNC